MIYLKTRLIFKGCNIYLKPERYLKSKIALSKVKSGSDFNFDNIIHDLRKLSSFQLFNICLAFK